MLHQKQKMIWIGLVGCGLALCFGLLLGLQPTIFSSFALKTQGSQNISISMPQKYHIGPQEWRNFRGDATLAGVIPCTLPSHSTILPQKLRWSFTTKAPIVATPVVAQQRIFFGAEDGEFYCLHIANGAVVWQKFLGDSPVVSSGNTNTQVDSTMMNKEEQPILQRRHQGGIEAPALLVQDHILVGTRAGFLYCMDQSNGELLWRYDAVDKIVGSANIAVNPDTQQEYVVVGSYDSHIHCLDRKTGQLLWQYPTESYINGTCAMLLQADHLHSLLGVVGGCDAQIHCINLQTGKAANIIAAGSHIAGSPAIAQDQILVGNYSNTVMAISISQASILWEYHTTDEEAAFCSIPAIGQDMVVVGSRNGIVYCLERNTGQCRWQFATQGEVDSSPVLLGQCVLFGSRDGRIYALHITTGKQLWALPIAQPIVSSPVIVENSLLITTLDGQIQCWDLQVVGEE